MDAIKELNYIPNAAARGLKCRKTFHIAYICDDVKNGHFSEMLQELEKISYKCGYFVSLCTTRADEGYIDELLGMHFDGIIITSMRLSVQQINRLSVVPTVMLLNRDASEFDPRISKLVVDIYGGEKSAMRYLEAIGRKKIAFVECIGETPINKSVVDFRKVAYLDATKEQGIEPIVISSLDYDGLFHKITELMRSSDSPDAFVCHDDNHAIVVSSACTKAGKVIPDDVTIVGYDGISMLKYQSVPISSVEIPRSLMAQKAMHMLLAMIEDNVTSTEYVDTTLLIRI